MFKKSNEVRKINYNQLKKILAYLIWQQKGLVVFITKEWGVVQLQKHKAKGKRGKKVLLPSEFILICCI